MSNCCNPYGKTHSKKQSRKSTLIKDFERCKAVFPKFNWSKGQHLCVNCRLRILQDYKLLQIVREATSKPGTKKKAPSVDAEASNDEDNSGPAVQDDASAPADVSDQESVQQIRDQEPAYDDNQPCSSQQALARVTFRTPLIPTPTPSVQTSAAGTDGTSESKSSSSGENGQGPAEKLNTSLKKVTFSPARPSDIQKPHILRRKLKKFTTAAGDAFKKLTGVEPSPEANRHRRCKFCKMLLAELSEKFDSQETRADKYKLLTSIPKRFTIAQVVEATGCSQYIARRANQLKKDKGAFSCPRKIQGRPMDKADEDLIQQFYLHDDNSRASPNQRDVMQVKLSNGEKMAMEKRRLLHNLKDLYSEFKTNHPEIPVSISKFAKLRPRNCVWPGLKGHHETCVCEIHQNFEFLLEAINCQQTVSEFVKSVVCEDDAQKNPDCHLGLCNKCPKQNVLEELLNDALIDDQITVTEWTHTDSTDIQTNTMSAEDFKTKFMEYVPKIIEHEYVTQKQRGFLRKLRDMTIKEQPAITVQVDFAQNYTFIVQNAVQGFHWSNKQATVHPFVAHWWDAEEEVIKYRTYCVISDELTHDADTFHVMRSAVMPVIKRDLEHIQFQKVYYISDGAGSQYKNIKNFANLMCHQEDYAVDAEWHFTSTSHGKGTCDAMSAVVKCCTRRQSLKPGKFITNPQQMFDYCNEHLTSPTLSFLFVSKDDISQQKPELAERYKKFKPIQGTRKHHAFIPKLNELISLGRTSDAESFVDVDIRKVEASDFTSTNIKIGQFYSFYEGRNYQIGLVVEINSSEGDVKFQVMRLKRKTRVASWPDIITFTDVAFRDVLHEMLDPTTDDGKMYLINKDDMATIRKKCSLYKSKFTSTN